MKISCNICIFSRDNHRRCWQPLRFSSSWGHVTKWPGSPSNPWNSEPEAAGPDSWCPARKLWAGLLPNDCSYSSYCINILVSAAKLGINIIQYTFVREIIMQKSFKKQGSDRLGRLPILYNVYTFINQVPDRPRSRPTDVSGSWALQTAGTDRVRGAHHRMS